VSKPDIERLRVLVIANVTPGPWRFDGPHVIGGVEAGFHAYIACRQVPGGITNGDPSATAKLIAACDPQTILGLISAASEAEALRAERDALLADRNTCGSGAGCLHKEAVIDSLRAEVARLQVIAADAERWAKDSNERDEFADVIHDLRQEVGRLKIDADRLDFLDSNAATQHPAGPLRTWLWARPFGSNGLRKMIDAAIAASKPAGEAKP